MCTLLKNKKILLGVSGGIAVYKACDLTSKLVQQGADVRVMMTKSATKFVSPLTFQALSRNDVYVDTFDEKDPRKIAHIDVADWAEIVIIAPATANIISKLSYGIADDMLTTTLLATRADVYIAPAMNVHMYQHPAVMENMKKLEKWGYYFIEPGAGYLACGYVGKGRLEEPLTIVQAVHEHQQTSQLLTGKNILISAGPTREILDPVRFFSNRSTGRMGFAFAEAAANFGANVTLIAGPVELDVNHPKINRINVVSAQEMYEAMWKYYETTDIVIKSAAVADYRPKIEHNEKMKKQPDDMVVEMERTEDILQSLGEMKKNQFLVGFAAETTDAFTYGKDKLMKKHLDAIIINNIAAAGAGFGHDTNIVTYLNKQAEQTDLPLASKRKIAEQVLKIINADMKDDMK